MSSSGSYAKQRPVERVIRHRTIARMEDNNYADLALHFAKAYLNSSDKIGRPELLLSFAYGLHSTSVYLELDDDCRKVDF